MNIITLPETHHMRIKALAVALALSVATPALAGPPWISIELPANPYDRASRGAFLLVHTFHHSDAIGVKLSGTAEGILSGQRRSVPLRFEPTSRTGVYAVRNLWGSAGVWTLVIGMKQGDHAMDHAQALVEIGANGEVSSVKVPTRQEREHILPSPVAMKDIEQGLRARAGR